MSSFGQGMKKISDLEKTCHLCKFEGGDSIAVKTVYFAPLKSQKDLKLFFKGKNWCLTCKILTAPHETHDVGHTMCNVSYNTCSVCFRDQRGLKIPPGPLTLS